MEETVGRTEQGTESLRKQTLPKAQRLLVIDKPLNN
jgi:hypothetical protein